MYSWAGDPSEWYGKGKYTYSKTNSDKRKAAADKERETGPRTYSRKGKPDTQRTDPKKKIRTSSKNPVLVCIDVTGSMAQWPFEIFDRLPLLYNTLSQYREDLEIAFLAIGDITDTWPLQVTSFGDGHQLEANLDALYGEGGGGDIPEAYGLLAWYLDNRVQIENSEARPFVIVFGDAPMHETVPKDAIEGECGIKVSKDVDSFAAWDRVAQRFDTWFLRRPTGRPGDATDQSWQKALGAKRVVQIEDEARAVDCAMGIIARAWGHLEDFEENMLARQPKETVDRVTHWIQRFGVAALSCPKCSAPIPPGSVGRFTCAHCGATLEL